MKKEVPPVLSPGQVAPDFTAEAIGGEYGEVPTKISLSAFRGHTVVLYFYPKDDTPGCTKQACGLRDRWEELGKADAKIFGVSVDPIQSHLAFIRKQALPFALIADPDKSIVQAYGVWVEKSMYGKKYLGTERSTFVIRPDGTIKSILRKVKPEEHTDKLAEALRG